MTGRFLFRQLKSGPRTLVGAVAVEQGDSSSCMLMSVCCAGRRILWPISRGCKRRVWIIPWILLIEYIIIFRAVSSLEGCESGVELYRQKRRGE